MSRHGWSPKEPPPGTEPLDISSIGPSMGPLPRPSPLDTAIKGCNVVAISDLVQRMEDALCRIALIHQEEGFSVSLTTIAACQDIARGALAHLPHYEIAERAERHQRADR